eukprot:s2688_g3.t1
MRYGDYVRIQLPPPKMCTATTGEVLHDSRILSADELWRRYYVPSSPSASSSDENVSPGLVGSDVIRAEFGRRNSSDEDQDAFSSLQAKPVQVSAPLSDHSGAAVLSSLISDSISLMQLSQAASSSNQPAPLQDTLVPNDLADSCLLNPRGLSIWPHWYRALTTAFDDTAVVEDDDEGRVAYFDTWYADCRHESVDEGRRCTLHRGAIDRTWEEPILAGENVHLAVPAPGARSHDAILSHPRGVASVQTAPPVVDIHAPSMRLEDQSDFIQHLHTIWSRRAALGPASIERFMSVMTWYLDGQYVRYNDAKRQAILGDDFTTWEDQLRAVWADLEDASLDVIFVFVQPIPACSPMDELHVLLIQQPDNATYGCVITTYDSSVNQGRPFSAAAFVPNMANRISIIQAAKREQVCLTRNEGAHCRTWYEGTEIGDAAPFFVRAGLNFNLHIHHPFLVDWEGGQEAVGLLQTRAHLSPPVPAHLHETSREWLNLPIWDFSSLAHELRVYFDGSFLPASQTAGMAFAVYVRSYGDWFNAGFLSSALAVPDSYVAELQSAIATVKVVYDLLKLIATLQPTLPQVWIGFDSLTVGSQLLGHWQCRQQPIMGKCLRMLVDLIETRFAVRCQGWHIPSHQGEPGNEFVDALASAAAAGFATHDLSHFFDVILQRPFVDAGEWMWVLFAPEFADRWQDHLIVLPGKPVTSPDFTLLPDHLQLDSMFPVQENVGSLNLRLATPNVLTLKGQTETVRGIVSGPTRQAVILQQMHADGINIFALQETRLRRQHAGVDPNYLLFASPATDAGHFGILMGFSTQIPHGRHIHNGKQVDLFFQKDHFAVVAATPRLLVLRVRTPVLKCLVIGAHAPHTGASESDIASWWLSVSAAVPAAYEKWDTILLVDANARVGSFPSQHVGSWQAEEDTTKSDSFVDFLERHELWLPATFESYQQGDGGTWKHPNGKWLRNDFIALPLSWQPRHLGAFINENIDVSTVKEDHAVATVEVCSDVMVRLPTRRRSPVKRHDQDLYGIDLSGSAAPFQVDWNVDVHTHADRLQQYLLQQIPKQPRVQRPLKGSMSEHTWTLVQEKRFWRNQMWDANRSANLLWLQACFDSWRRPPAAYSVSDLSSLVKQTDLLCATAYGQFRSLGRQVVKAMRADDVEFFARLSSQASEYLNPPQARSFWSVIRRSLPKMRLRRQAPNPFQLEHLEDQWHPYFQALEVGSSVDPSQLVSECHTFQMQQDVDASICPLTALPSRSQIAEAFRATHSYRATGLDLMPSSLLHLFPTQMARLCMDLFMKVFLWQMEPIQGKGGILAVIPKKNDHSRAAHFRGIMLLPSVFKRLHAILRQQLVNVIAPLKPAGQIGGFQGQQVQYGSMTLQCLSRVAKHKQLSMGVVFVDLANAFHRLIRELVCGIAREDDVQTLLDSLSDASSLGVRKWLEMPSLLQRLGAPDRLIKLLRDVHVHTWHTFAAHPGLTRTRRGTRPGSPLADVIFHVIMLDVTIELNSWVEEQGTFQSLLRELDIDLEAIVWSDDLAIPWLTRAADDLLPAIECLMQQIYKVFSRRGFDLNMQKGKTAAVLTFRGSGAPTLRRQYQLINPSGMQCQLSATESCWLHFAPAYKHLGTFLAADGGFQTELASRIGQAKAAFSSLSRPVLCNKHLPARIRLRLFHALVGTKLFFGLGSWPSPTGKHLKTLNAFLVQCLRKILGLAHFEGSVHTTDAQVFSQARCLDARARLAIDRLLFAQKLFQHGPAFVHHLLHREHEIHPASWIQSVMTDLHWLHRLDPNAVPASWTTDLTDPIDFWQSGALGWKSQLRRLGRRHIQQEAMMADVSTWHRKIFHVLMHAGGTFSPSPFDFHLNTNLPDYQCFCGRAFTSAVGLATHQRKQHSVFSPEHHLLSGATCPVCMKHFWSTQRLQQHLAYVSRRTGRNDCFQTLMNAGYQTTYERVSLPVAFTGLDRINWIEASGPRPLFPDQRVSAIVRCEEELARLQQELCFDHLPNCADDVQAQLFEEWNQQTWLWFESFCQQGHDPSVLIDLEGRWVVVLCEFDAKYDKWLEWCFRTWGQNSLPDILATFEDGEAEALVDEAFAALVAKLPSDASYARVTFLRARIHMLMTQTSEVPHRPIRMAAPARVRDFALPEVPMSYESQDEWHAQLRKVAWQDLPPEQVIPRLLRGQGLHLLVVHLFSGRRRLHDIHWWIAEWSARKNIAVTILSMDTAVSVECGNLTVTATSWQRLVELYEAGAVAATIAGAPCETFSAARHLEPPAFAAHLRWPRPLRSAQRLFGLPFLTSKELRQCQQGTAFSLQTLWTASMHISKGGVFLSEHPACPEDPDTASIWKAAITQLLLGHPDCTLHTVPQWKWGSATPKPTGLFSVRIPTLLRSLYACADPNLHYPAQIAQGVDEQGRFRTSRCKEYPPLFCQAIARAITDRFEFAMRSGGISECTIDNSPGGSEPPLWLRLRRAMSTDSEKEVKRTPEDLNFAEKKVLLRHMAILNSPAIFDGGLRHERLGRSARATCRAGTEAVTSLLCLAISSTSVLLTSLEGISQVCLVGLAGGAVTVLLTFGVVPVLMLLGLGPAKVKSRAWALYIWWLVANTPRPSSTAEGALRQWLQPPKQLTQPLSLYPRQIKADRV